MTFNWQFSGGSGPHHNGWNMVAGQNLLYLERKRIGVHQSKKIGGPSAPNLLVILWVPRSWWLSHSLTRLTHCEVDYFSYQLLVVLGNTLLVAAGVKLPLLSSLLLKRAITLHNILPRNTLFNSNITQEYRKILANYLWIKCTFLL